MAKDQPLVVTIIDIQRIAADSYKVIMLVNGRDTVSLIANYDRTDGGWDSTGMSSEEWAHFHRVCGVNRAVDGNAYGAAAAFANGTIGEFPIDLGDLSQD
jgi:hypothetical protein